jgi:hypothetical protein
MHLELRVQPDARIGVTRGGAAWCRQLVTAWCRQTLMERPEPVDDTTRSRLRREWA